jgi:hypothetical protein
MSETNTTPPAIRPMPVAKSIDFTPPKYANGRLPNPRRRRRRP